MPHRPTWRLPPRQPTRTSVRRPSTRNAIPTALQTTNRLPPIRHPALPPMSTFHRLPQQAVSLRNPRQTVCPAKVLHLSPCFRGRRRNCLLAAKHTRQQCAKFQTFENASHQFRIDRMAGESLFVQFDRRVRAYRGQFLGKKNIIYMRFDFSFKAPFNRSVLAMTFSTESNSKINLEAVFSPTPGHPVILSTLSPIKASMSITCEGRLMPNTSHTSFHLALPAVALCSPDDKS